MDNSAKIDLLNKQLSNATDQLRAQVEAGLEGMETSEIFDVLEIDIDIVIEDKINNMSVSDLIEFLSK